MFFFLAYFCMIGSSFIHLIRTDSNVFFLMAEYWLFLNFEDDDVKFEDIDKDTKVKLIVSKY